MFGRTMKHSLILVAFLIAFCTSTRSQSLADREQLAQIKKSIKSQYKSWAIFSNGTYLVITSDSTTSNLENRAIQILLENGNAEGKIVHKNSFVLDIKKIDGWIVDSPFQGLYTYVSNTELKDNGVLNPTNAKIVLFAMAKRQKDIIEHKIVETSH